MATSWVARAKGGCGRITVCSSTSGDTPGCSKSVRQNDRMSLDIPSSLPKGYLYKMTCVKGDRRIDGHQLGREGERRMRADYGMFEHFRRYAGVLKERPSE